MTQIDPTASPITPGPESITVPEPSPDPTPDPSPAPETFSREYVQELRQEAAENRVKARELEQQHEALFGDLDPETQESVRALVEIVRSGDPDAAREAIRILEQAVPEQPEYATMRDVESRLEAERASIQRERDIDGIYEQAKQYGYKRDTRAITSLLWEMTEGGAQDMAEAHRRLEAEKQEWIDQWVATKRQPTVTTPAGAAPGSSPAPKTMREAKAAAMARFGQ